MISAEAIPPTRVLLLVEDNPGEVELVREMLLDTDEEATDRYKLIHASSMAAARAQLAGAPVDVVLLDLSLPDTSGVQTVAETREAAHNTPIVVLTGHDDARLADHCLHAGAHDFLRKSEVNARQLRRAIGYAVSRRQRAMLMELQQQIDDLSRLGTARQSTTVTAGLSRTGALRQREPTVFDELQTDYVELLHPYLVRALPPPSRGALERLITRLGDHGGGPRDLIDVHVAALEQIMADARGTGLEVVVAEARIVAISMMGLLVDYYRVGYRRR